MNKPEILKSDFEALLAEAIEDLYMSGMSHDEICRIIEQQFGLKYAEKYCSDM
jgi:hypothetical protein